MKRSAAVCAADCGSTRVRAAPTARRADCMSRRQVSHACACSADEYWSLRDAGDFDRFRAAVDNSKHEVISKEEDAAGCESRDVLTQCPRTLHWPLISACCKVLTQLPNSNLEDLLVQHPNWRAFMRDYVATQPADLVPAHVRALL